MLIPYQSRERCASRVFTFRGVSSLFGAHPTAVRSQGIGYKNASHFPMVEKWKAIRANGPYRMLYAAPYNRSAASTRCSANLRPYRCPSLSCCQPDAFIISGESMQP